jgi:hypothetical protein
MAEGCFTVTFENPYWVGILERFDECGYSVAKIIFGPDPSAEVIHSTILRSYQAIKFSKPIPDRPVQKHEMNYKRRQRELNHLLETKGGLSSEVSEALDNERKRKALERKQQEKAERESKAAHKLQVRLERKKEKKKGH